MGSDRLSQFRRSLGLSLVVGFMVAIATVTANALTLQGSRWLAVDRLSGQVSLIPYQGNRRAARLGDRLSNVGDILVTSDKSSARLAVDAQTGFVTMAENTQVQVQALSLTRSGGRITELAVSRGQVRLRVRPLTNPGTRLEIRTPSGVSGVRGTDFGVTVPPNGQTGVATLTGSVATSAQGKTVAIVTGTQSVVYPGEAPLPPEPLRDDPTLFVERLSFVAGSSSTTPMVRLVGYTDKVNLLKVNNDLKELSRTGRFDLVVPLFEDSAANNSENNPRNRLRNRYIQATVTTPLGKEQQYELVMP